MCSQHEHLPYSTLPEGACCKPQYTRPLVTAEESLLLVYLGPGINGRLDMHAALLVVCGVLEPSQSSITALVFRK